MLNAVAGGDRVLREGQNGPAVKRLQTLLNKHGAHLAADGDFGNKTEAALKRFQRAQGLPVTGRLNHATLDKLERGVQRPDEFIKKGDSSARITGIERGLKRLGYDVGAVDGKYDATMAKAVAAFKHDQHLKQTHGGSMTGSVQRQLRTELRALEHAPTHIRRKPTAARTRLDAHTAQAARVANADGVTGIGSGAPSRAVKNVQGHLRAAGFDPKNINGVFDERTGAAVKAFQRRTGLEQTGKVDARTWRELSKSTMEARTATSPAQRKGEKSDAVKRTEVLLKKAGFKTGKVDGVFDHNTEAAVRAFERKHKLGVDGKIDTKDLNALKKAAANDGDAKKAKEQMQALMKTAQRGAAGKRPLGWCLREVQNYLDRTTYGKGKVPRLPYARNFAEYLNRDGNAAKLGLKRLNITNPYDAPPGAIIVVRPGTPGTSHPTAGDIVVKGPGDKFYNDGEMGYGGRGNFPRGNNYVLGVYVPAGYKAK